MSLGLPRAQAESQGTLVTLRNLCQMLQLHSSLTQSSERTRWLLGLFTWERKLLLLHSANTGPFLTLLSKIPLFYLL